MVSVNLSSDLVEQAKIHAGAMSRFTPKQIEHWAKIGKLSEQNPDLPYEFLQNILIVYSKKSAAKQSPMSLARTVMRIHKCILK